MNYGLDGEQKDAIEWAIDRIIGDIAFLKQVGSDTHIHKQRLEALKSLLVTDKK